MNPRIQRTAEFLDNYLKVNVWNTPQLEYQRTVKLLPVASTAMQSVVRLQGPDAVLPTANTLYYAFMVPAQIFAGIMTSGDDSVPLEDYFDSFDNSDDTWVDLLTLFQNTGLELRLFHPSGIVIPKATSFIGLDAYGENYLIVIQASTLNKVLADQVTKTDLRVSLYHDSDEESTSMVTAGSLVVQNDGIVDNRGEMIRRLFVAVGSSTTEFSRVILFRNGREIPMDWLYVNGGYQVDVLKHGDILDWIYDRNIIGELQLSINELRATRKFLTADNLKEYLLIHIPKTINTDYHMLCHTTCDLFVRDQQALQDGYYFHRDRAADQITQISFSDFGILNTALNTYMSKLTSNGSDAILRVLIRKHSAANLMVPDACYSDKLYYYHDDENIVKFLMNTHPSQMEFWKASTLMDSEFTTVMMEYPTTVTADNLNRFIDALGYYNTLILISTRVFSFVVASNQTGKRSYSVPTPVIYTSERIKGFVYKNGVKCQGMVSTTTSGLQTLLHITPSNKMPDGSDFSVAVGDVLTFELFEAPDYTGIDQGVTEITPDASTSVIALPYSAVEVLNVTTNASAYFFSWSASNFKKLVTGATELTSSELFSVEITDTGCIVTFAPAAYGYKFRLINRCALYQLVRKYVIDPTVPSPEYNRLVLRDTLIDPVMVSPVLFPGDFKGLPSKPITVPMSYLMYLNGRKLVLGVDYTVIHRTDSHNRTVGYEIILTNVDYLSVMGSSPDALNGYQTSNSCIELYATRDETVVNIRGHLMKTTFRDGVTYWVIDDVLGPAPWNLTVGTLTIEGRLITDAIYEFGKILIPKTQGVAGQLFNVQTIAPAFATFIMEEYKRSEDDTTLDALNTYFANLLATPTTVVLVSKTHAIYSFYAALMVKTVLARTEITNPYDIDGYMTLNSPNGIADFEWIKAYDPVFNDSLLDLDFIDVYPAYHRIGCDVTVNTSAEGVASYDAQEQALALKKVRLIQLVLGRIMPEDQVIQGGTV